MSRGLGKVQRAILGQLAGRQYTSITELAARVYQADFPADENEDTDPAAYGVEYLRALDRVSRAQYVATFRAVQALERAGLVQTEIHIPKPIFGYLMPGTVRWKSVKLSVDSQSSLSTLRSVAE